MQLKKKETIFANGQASLEYLLTLTAVFVALAGVASLFSNQVNRYLSWLLDLIVLPF